jgi:putative glycosyltransferase (TIGR04372 family)
MNILALRLGKVVERNYFMDNLINLTEGRGDEWSDIVAIEIAKFFVSGTSGIMDLSTLLRKPQLCVNLIPFDLYHLSRCAQKSIFIPKKLKNLSTGNFLSLSESIDLFKDWSIHEKNFFMSRKIQVINNSREEIRNALIEMIKRTNDHSQETQIQCNIRKKLQKIYNDDFSNYVFNDLGIQLSTSFVKQNAYWFFK